MRALDQPMHRHSPRSPSCAFHREPINPVNRQTHLDLPRPFFYK